ncbi:thioredoxin fold domain-containing protein [Cupriavidus sp. WS]|uniref:thioredoxin fold domain-containing protein n=1 Tax=Cupriavidus sp. WS TaxID=1312922 RepID=UPI00035CE13F|nr:thioredoxin fold domain-containing protein [Cupriavidus sp. WS]
MYAKLLLPALLVLALGACGKSAPDAQGTAPASAAAQPATAISVDAIAAATKGFSAGNLLSAKKVYVFFDPQCPHCGELWKAATPLMSSVHFTWIPVALLTPERSAQQGAALLDSKDAVKTMNSHEATLATAQRGLDTAGMALPEQALAQVKANTEYFLRLGITSVPFVVFAGEGGQAQTFEGALSTDALKARLGV